MKRKIAWILILVMVMLVPMQMYVASIAYAEPVTVAFLSIAKLLGYTALTMGGGYAAYQAYASWAPSNMLTELMGLSGMEVMAVSSALMQSIRNFILGENISLIQMIEPTIGLESYHFHSQLSNTQIAGNSFGITLSRFEHQSEISRYRVWWYDQDGTELHTYAFYDSYFGLRQTKTEYDNGGSIEIARTNISSVSTVRTQHNGKISGPVWISGNYVYSIPVQGSTLYSGAESIATGVIGADIPLGSDAWDYDSEGRYKVPGWPGSWNPTHPTNPALDTTPAPSDYVNTPVDQILEQGYTSGTITDPFPQVGELPTIGVDGLTGALQQIWGSIIGALQAIYTGITAIPASLANILASITAFFAIPTDAVANINMDPLKNLPLLTKFPFCIPFDLITAMSSLADSGNAPPSWTLSWMNVDFDMDFTIFNPVAQIVRYFTGLSFTLALILKTRELVKG